MASILSQRTVVGTIANVYALREIGSDNAVINFSVAVTPRVRDENDEWGDGETEWIRCTAWRKLARNIAESFNVGDRVILYGRVTVDPARTNANTGEEIPPTPNFVVDFAGLEVGSIAAHSERTPNKKTQAQEAASEDGDEAPRKAQKPVAKKTESKPEKKVAPKDDFEDDDDLFGDDDDDIDAF